MVSEFGKSADYKEAEDLHRLQTANNLACNNEISTDVTDAALKLK